MPSDWNHHMCEECWRARNPKKTPARLNEEWREEAVCCYCGATHKSGIFVRADPRLIGKCKGHE